MNEERFRLRDLGFKIGILPTGKLNLITDVPGVLVGHSTIIKGEGNLNQGKGPIRTGITIIKPHAGNVFREKVQASSYVFNGYGKTIGLIQIQELGNIESFIALTNTLNVPLVADALIEYHIQENLDIGIDTSTINVVVGECHDGKLNDIQGRHVKKEHVFEAINNTQELFEEGSVGAGTGMTALGYKAGIGSSSRLIKEGELSYILGSLVLSNFGMKGDLIILGKKFDNVEEIDERIKGSIIVVLATDAPLNSRQLHRLAKRAPLGISRTGSFGSHGSGDVIIAFSTKNKIVHDSKEQLIQTSNINENTKIFRQLLRAVVETTEEAILNSILMASTIIGRDNNKSESISIEKVKEILSK